MLRRCPKITFTLQRNCRRVIAFGLLLARHKLRRLGLSRGPLRAASPCLRHLPSATLRRIPAPQLRALKPRQSNPNESDSICASRRRSVSGAPLTIFGVANFGRPQHQHDTFDLAKLPSGSVIETAAAPQIKKTPSLAVESESSPRSTDNSAERDSRAKRDSRRPREPC